MLSIMFCLGSDLTLTIEKGVTAVVLHFRPHEHYADWKKGIRPAELIDYLNSKRNVSDNRVSWAEMAAQDYFYCIADMVNTSIGYNLTSHLVRKIINDPTISLDADIIIREFRRHMYQALSQKATPEYSLYTRIDGMSRLGFPKFRCGELNVMCKIPKKFAVDKAEFKSLAIRSGVAYECQSDTGILIQATGYHIGDFAESAIECINYICGVFNLMVDPKTYVIFGKRDVPSVWMSSAPIFFLFEGDNRSDTFYRESRFGEVAKGKQEYEDIANLHFTDMRKAISKADKKLSFINLRSAIARLHIAKSDPDINNRFIKLWSLLEVLTLAGADHGKVCYRISNFFAGSQLGVMANIARHFRNSAVHEGREHTNTYIYTHYLSEMCSQFIRFYIASGYKFSGESHLVEYLDTPRSEDAFAKLQKEVRTMKFRIRDLEFSHKRLSKQFIARRDKAHVDGG
jgi:hypothetical protein